VAVKVGTGRRLGAGGCLTGGARGIAPVVQDPKGGILEKRVSVSGLLSSNSTLNRTTKKVGKGQLLGLEK